MSARNTLVALALWLVAATALADNMLMARVALKADIVFAYAEASIQEHGYAIAHVQTCDDGLGDFGYKTDFYRTLFFGKVEEVRRIAEHYPELASYVPLKMAVIAERDETLLVVLNPEALAPFFADETVQIQLQRWHSDIVSILDDITRGATAHRAEAG
jgi:uncharacterized protein (DUF302 family)